MVDMGCHQAIRKDLDLVALSVTSQKIKINPAILVLKEHLATSAAPLNDVVGYTWNHYAATSWHIVLIATN